MRKNCWWATAQILVLWSRGQVWIDGAQFNVPIALSARSRCVACAFASTVLYNAADCVLACHKSVKTMLSDAGISL